MKRIEIKVGNWTGHITAKQLQEVLLVAGNGYSEGEYYYSSDGSDSGFGGKRGDRMYQAGIGVLKEAVQQAL